MVFRCALKNEIGRIHVAHLQRTRKSINKLNCQLIFTYAYNVIQFYGIRKINETHISSEIHFQKLKNVYMNPWNFNFNREFTWRLLEFLLVCVPYSTCATTISVKHSVEYYPFIFLRKSFFFHYFLHKTRNFPSFLICASFYLVSDTMFEFRSVFCTNKQNAAWILEQFELPFYIVDLCCLHSFALIWFPFFLSKW